MEKKKRLIQTRARDRFSVFPVTFSDRRRKQNIAQKIEENQTRARFRRRLLRHRGLDEEGDDKLLTNYTLNQLTNMICDSTTNQRCSLVRNFAKCENWD